MSLNEFPQIPFVTNEYGEGFIKKIEALESDVSSLQDLIELWHKDGKNERLSLDNILFTHRVLFNLRHLKFRNFPLVELAGKEELSLDYYKKLLPFYIKKLHLIKCSLVKFLVQLHLDFSDIIIPVFSCIFCLLLFNYYPFFLNHMSFSSNKLV